MLGAFQQSNIRIEVEASESQIRDSLCCANQISQWLWIQDASSLPIDLQVGDVFTSWAGFIPIQHQVERVEPNALRLIMSRGIDGFHQWHWGEGWIQSCLEGISPLPLGLGHTFNLLRLRQFLNQQ
jgi:hypothetical protein